MKDLTPLRAVRLHCRECSDNHPKQIRNCENNGCPLYLYRFGHNPKRKGKGSGNPLFGKKTQAHGEISETKGEV